MADAEREEWHVDGEAVLPVKVVSTALGDSTEFAGVSRSVSPRETTEEAELDTLPVELRFDIERREKAAAEEAVDVREDAGAPTHRGRSREVDRVGSEAVTWSATELRRLGWLVVASLDRISEESAKSSSSSSSWYLASEDWCDLNMDERLSSPDCRAESEDSGRELRPQLPERVTPPTPPSLARLIDSLVREDVEDLLWRSEYAS